MEACKELKTKYDHCFNVWFSEKFLRGVNDDSECAALLKVYTECVAVSYSAEFTLHIFLFNAMKMRNN
ncbi:TP53-regulated inhibitor of apoptosis 1 [Dufourea novaeangliae]|uniref:TP53-regulated inhibitor of apoptosis 1 n=1 Tax=Dufourea novaeangliae TaxID=178035 RepID=A0A154PHH9_DUFNO|nr:TP53-regulated inhibitor of apoptosis 1 [Dufourea novaeangliae]